MTSQVVKNFVISHVRKMMVPIPERIDRACLFWAYATVLALQARGIRAVLQAGSCSWPRIKMEEDDGVCLTHFSYQFELGAAIQKLMQGGLPEIHCWAAIPDRNEIIDLTTEYLPKNCEETAGLPWIGEAPPPYLWSTVEDLPEYWMYDPEINAIKLSLDLLREAESARLLEQSFKKLRRS